MNVTTLFAGPIDASRVRVNWTSAPAISDCARGRIDHQWAIYLDDAQKKNITLFNGPAICMKSWRTENGGLTLDLFAGDYKSFIVTCVRDHAWFAKNAPDAICPALGNSALLTHGENAYLGVRSKSAALNPGLAHVFGGVPEYEGHCITIAEILAHLLRELHEEAALVPEDFADKPTLLALFHESTLHQPELVWQWPLRAALTRAAAEEHDCVRVLSRSEKQAQGLTPLTAAAAQLWQNVK